MQHDVFVSYSTKDTRLVDALVHHLESRKIRCWFAPRDIKPGREYADVIVDAIKSAKIILVAFSDAAQISRWVRSEVNCAISNGKVIIPVKISDVLPQGAMQLYLGDKHWIDIWPNPSSRLLQVVSEVDDILRRKIDIASNAKSICGRPFGKVLKITGFGLMVSVLIVGLTAVGVYFLKRDALSAEDRGTRMERERLSHKAAYELASRELDKNLLAPETTKDMLDNGWRTEEFLQKWLDVLLKWKVSNARYEGERNNWRAWVNQGKKKVEDVIAQSPSDGTMWGVVASEYRTACYGRMISDMLLPEDEFNAREEIWSAIKSASANFMGQNIQFEDGVADWTDVEEGNESCKIWLRREFIWRVDNVWHGYYAFANADTSEAWHPITGKGPTQKRLNLLVRFQEGRAVKFRKLNFSIDHVKVCNYSPYSGKFNVVFKTDGESLFRKLDD